MKRTRNNDEGMSAICHEMDRDARIIAQDEINKRAWIKQKASKATKNAIKEFSINKAENPQHLEDDQGCQLSGAESGNSYEIIDS